MKNISNKNKKIIVVVLCLLIFFLILRDVFIYEVTSYDNWAYSVFVINLRSDFMTNIMKIFTFFGNALAFFLIVGFTFLLSKNKDNGVMLTTNLALIFILNSIVKTIVQRPRPSGYNLIVESNYSFPSGHSMVSTAFYGYFIYLIYKNVKNKKIKYLLISLLFLLIMLICISRIYLGVHYLSDTLAGFFLSIAYLMIFITFIPRFYKEKKRNAKKKKENKN